MSKVSITLLSHFFLYSMSWRTSYMVLLETSLLTIRHYMKRGNNHQLHITNIRFEIPLMLHLDYAHIQDTSKVIEAIHTKKKKEPHLILIGANRTLLWLTSINTAPRGLIPWDIELRFINRPFKSPLFARLNSENSHLRDSSFSFDSNVTNRPKW